MSASGGPAAGDGDGFSRSRAEASARIEELVEGAATFRAYAAQYEELVADHRRGAVDDGTMEMAVEKVVEAWRAAEAHKQEVEQYIAELGLVVEYEDGTEAVTDIPDLLFRVQDVAGTVQGDVPDGEAAARVSHVEEVVGPAYGAISRANWDYLAAIDVIHGAEPYMREQPVASPEEYRLAEEDDYVTVDEWVEEAVAAARDVPGDALRL